MCVTGNKLYTSCALAMRDIVNGCTIGISGNEGRGEPLGLMCQLTKMNVTNLRIIYNVPVIKQTIGSRMIHHMISDDKISELITPSYPHSEAFDVHTKMIKNTMVNFIDHSYLAEKLRIKGAGLGGIFYSSDPIGDKEYLGLNMDVALVKSDKTDTLGNTVYSGSNRNYSPIMAIAAHTTIVETNDLVEIGALDPECIVTPGIFVNRIVLTSEKLTD